jgi:ethanolamine kinase
MEPPKLTNGDKGHLRYIPLSYNNADSHASVTRLMLTLNPDWEHGDGPLDAVRFTDGITNTVRRDTKRVVRRELRLTDPVYSC